MFWRKVIKLSVEFASSERSTWVELSVIGLLYAPKAARSGMELLVKVEKKGDPFGPPLFVLAGQPIRRSLNDTVALYSSTLPTRLMLAQVPL